MVVKVADTLVFQSTGMHLRDVEIKVLIGSWEGLTYVEIAERFGYSADYLNKDVGNKLWRKLRKALNEPVSKNNFQEPMKRWLEKHQPSEPPPDSRRQSDSVISEVYIERPPIETRCFEAIQQPGALVRIKAPQKMGKTWLMNQVLGCASEAGYQTVTIDLKLADCNIFCDLETFLQWFCANTADSLDLEDQFEKYWRSSLGASLSCTRYFQKYLLVKIEEPLILAFDNFDVLFERESIFKDFCSLLRGWHEQAKLSNTTGQCWKQLHLIVVNSTQSYPTLDINYSPFNVGKPIVLPTFTLSQVKELAQSFHINEDQLDERGYSPLMEMVGGHPDLIQQALSNLHDYPLTLMEVLADSATEGGIYGNYLRCLLSNLQNDPTLKTAFCRVLEAEDGIQLGTKQAFQLHSMGLVSWQGNACVISCQLFRDYFRKHLDCTGL
ncbi:AAA-like domain-containing protein (plasmid) [Acaryochloris sp. CCMEE 5410]|nr:AAA-like domain-containing protein [Acaryochloris sp. CCMEE 5410]